MTAGGDAEFRGTPRFEILSRLGAGANGIVYRALDRERGAMVALKTLRRLDAEALLLFKNEFRALQDLQHPNLIRLGELIEERGQWFFTMELIEGVDFLSWVRPRKGAPGDAASPFADTDALANGPPPAAPQPASIGGVLDEARLRAALADLARGLAALHEAHKVHRDIKPSNILVTRDGRVVLVDFGLVTEVAGADREVVGTSAYMAPEQAASKPVGPAADAYATGVVLYQALTGALPFGGPMLQVMMDKQRHEPQPPRARATDCPTDLDALCVELLRFDPAARPNANEILQRLDGAQPATPSSQRQASPFIGRSSELERLRAALDVTRAGSAVTVLVHGASGVGKTALVREFTHRLAVPEGGVLLAGRCYERESVPYKAFDGVVDALSRCLVGLSSETMGALLPPDVDLLVQVFPVLKRLTAVAEAPPPRRGALDPPELRHRVFTALRELLRRLGQRQPLVIVIDDLQWADADSLALIDAMVRPPDAPALLLIGTLRSDEASKRMQGDVRALALGPLPAPDAQALAVSILPEMSPDEAAAIAREADGHPLFIDELVRHLKSGEVRTSLRLDDALWERVQRLDERERHVLELVALAGGPVSQRTIARAAAASFHELSAMIGVLRVAHLVRTAGVRADDSIEPYHDRVRAALLARLDDAALERCHYRLALALEGADPQDAEALAVHWRGAGDRARAAKYAARAAAQAGEALAFDRAARMFRMALELDAAGPDRRALLARLGEALANAGRGAESARAYLEAAEDAPSGEALALRGRAADQLLRSGHIDEGLSALRVVLEGAGMRLAKTPQRALPTLLLRRAQIRLRGLGFHERARDEIPAAELTRIDICWAAAACLGIVDTIRGADFQSHNLLLSLRAGEPSRIARSLALEAGYAAIAGASTGPRAARLLALADGLARRLDEPYAHGIVALGGAMIACLQGRWGAMRGECLRGEAIFRERCTGVAWEIASLQLLHVWSLFFLGELGQLIAVVPEQERRATERGDLYAATGQGTGVANLAWLAIDDLDAARERNREASARWSRQGFHLEHYWTLIGESHYDLYTGEGAAAWERIRARWPALRSSLLLTVQEAKIEAIHLRARCALAATLAGDRSALQSAASDAARLESIAAPWSRPLGRLVRGTIAAMRGDLESALPLFDEAASGFDGVDMAMYAAVTRLRRGQLLGGDEGSALAKLQESWMAEQGVRSPLRLAMTLAPGFP